MLYSFDNQCIDNRRELAPGEPTDERLMAKIQEGEESALDLLHRRHRVLLRTIISRIIHNDHDVDDMIQECLLEVWRRAANFDAEKGLALGWIVTLVRRRTIDRLRRKSAYGRAQERFRAEKATESGVVAHCGADEEAAQSDTAQVVARLIANLPKAQQDAVQLTYFRGMTQRQIAAFTGIPLGTIKTRLELALRKLRASVIAFGELHEALPSAHA